MRDFLIGFLTVISLLLTSFIPSQVQADEWETYGTPRTPASTGYTCQIDSECLDHLYNILLNQQSNESVYQVCKEAHKRNKDCCLDPSGCNAPYAEGSNLKENSHSFFQQHGGNATSCQLNNLSSLVSGLSQLQNNFCSNGKTHCREICKNRLEDLRRAFRGCFLIEDSYSISHVLEKAKNPTSHHDCYKEIRNVAEIYKRQSRNQTAVFKDHLESQDIVDCAAIGREKPASNLNSLAVNICQQAQQKRQEVESKQKQEQIALQKATAKTGPEIGAGNLSSSPGNRQNGGGLGSEALSGAGVAAGALALQKNSNKGKSSSRASMSKTAVNNDQRVFPGKNKNRHIIPLKQQKSKNGIDRQRENKAQRRASSPVSSLTGSELKTSSDTNLQIAQANSSSRNCPVSMPYIKSAIVFQSVEAPQIEPMSQQANLPYNNYDLVMGKQAGVLIELERRQMDRRKEFAMDFTISGENKYRNKCFHEPMKREMKEEQEDFCFFTIDDLRKEGYYKFFPLPMNENLLNKDGITRTAKLTLYPRGYANNSSCHEKKSFTMKVIKTHNLKLGFTRIYGGRNCYASKNRNTGYDTVDYNRVRSFPDSNEVSWNIPKMFPLVKVDSYALRYTFGGESWNYVEGDCNNSSAKDRPSKTAGMLSDVAELERIRASLGYHKLIAIIPESYFAFHEKRKKSNDASVGFIISPRWKEKRWYWFFGIHWFKVGFLGGSWNIAFVHEEELNKGTVAHELAHTAGQGKEFYEKNERCRRFRGSNFESCRNYKITRALSTRTHRGRQRWKFLENRFSIMSGTKMIRNREADIRDLWIDRDTYQKIFKVLSEKAVIPNDEELLGKSIANREYEREKESSLKVVITGFYYEKEKDFVVPDIKVQKTKLSTPSFYPHTENTKFPIAIFQLREGKRILQRIKIPIFKMQIKTLYKNKKPKTEPFEFSPLMAAFKLPPDYKRRDLRIVVLDPWGKEMYAVSVPKKSKSKPKQRSANAVEKHKRK